MTCPKTFGGKPCGGTMGPGVYLPQGVSEGDYDGFGAHTLSFGGVTNVQECLKCDRCGHSVAPRTVPITNFTILKKESKEQGQ